MIPLTLRYVIRYRRWLFISIHQVLIYTAAAFLWMHLAREQTYWFKKTPHKSAQVMADVGEMKVLPPHMADEIRNDNRLSFARWMSNVGF
jgi:hypothetical protein